MQYAYTGAPVVGLLADLSLWHAVLLGVVQGVTEWLPVSSSGHLVAVRHYLGTVAPVFFDLWLHLATLLALLLHQRHRLRGLLRSLLARDRDEAVRADRRWAWLVIVATLPIVVLGLLLREQVEAAFASTAAVGWSLLATTGLLVASHFGKVRSPFTVAAAVTIGVFQACALLPGVSRSGATIAGGMLVGLDRDRATDFSLLLAIPALLGALVLLLPDVVRQGPGVPWSVMVVGGVVTFGVGYLGLHLLVGMVRRWGLLPFAPYTLLLGLVLLLA